MATRPRKHRIAFINGVLSSFPDPLTRDEERKLLITVQKGGEESDFACAELVLCNMRFGIQYAARHSLIHSSEDLRAHISTIAVGLLRAARAYNTEKFTVAFCTYALYWVKRELVVSMRNDNCATVHIPAGTQNRKRKINKAITDIKQEKKADQVTDEEISDRLGLSLKVVRSLRMARLIGISLDTALETAGGGETDFTFEGVLKQEMFPDPHETARLREQKAILDRAVNTVLTKREKDIFKRRYLETSPEKRTFEAIGQALGGLTRERIRQIETRINTKLKIAIQDLLAGKKIKPPRPARRYTKAEVQKKPMVLPFKSPPI